MTSGWQKPSINLCLTVLLNLLFVTTLICRKWQTGSPIAVKYHSYIFSEILSKMLLYKSKVDIYAKSQSSANGKEAGKVDS